MEPASELNGNSKITEGILVFYCHSSDKSAINNKSTIDKSTILTILFLFGKISAQFLLSKINTMKYVQANVFLPILPTVVESFAWASITEGGFIFERNFRKRREQFVFRRKGAWYLGGATQIHLYACWTGVSEARG